MSRSPSRPGIVDNIKASVSGSLLPVDPPAEFFAKGGDNLEQRQWSVGDDGDSAFFLLNNCVIKVDRAGR
jgi:hypothetical protein